MPLAPIDAASDVGGYGVCYLGTTPEAAFVATFFRRLPSRVIAMSDLDARRITEIRLIRDVQVVCLHGSGLLRANVDGSVTSGDTYALSQVVARLLWRHPAKFDGIEYPARHDTHQFSVALFDRAGDALAVGATAPLTDPHRLRSWITRYKFGLV